MSDKRRKSSGAASAAPDPFDSPVMMGVHIEITVLENGIAVARAEVITKKGDPRADALVARFRGPIDAAAKALAGEISRDISGEAEGPDVIDLPGRESPRAASMPFVKMDGRGGKA